MYLKGKIWNFRRNRYTNYLGLFTGCCAWRNPNLQKILKVPMKQKFLLHYVKELLKLQYKFFSTFVIHCFVDEIFQFECFLLPANYITLCIMSFC